jgi:hypothetical protein
MDNFQKEGGALPITNQCIAVLARLFHCMGMSKQPIPMIRLCILATLLISANPMHTNAQDLAVNLKKVTPAFIEGTTPTPAKPAAQWQKEKDLVSGRIGKGQLTKMKAATDALVRFLQDSCLAGTSLQPLYRGEYFAEKGTSNLNLEFGNANLHILINDFSPLFGHMTANHRDYFVMAPVVANRNGCMYFEPGTRPAPASMDSSSSNTRCWLVTAKPDELPYIPITRKEYLQQVQTDLSATKAQVVAALKAKYPIRPADEQEAEKKKDLESLSALYSGMELQTRTKVYLNNYKSDEDYRKDAIEKETAELDSTLHLVDQMLQHLCASTLAAPAIVTPADKSFEGFADGEPGAVMLVRPNTSFIDAAASATAPRFLLITWTYDPSDKDAQDIDRQIAENMDTQSLKTMLRSE